MILACFRPREQQILPTFDLTASQVCGAWVEILPNLMTLARSGELISSATKALGMVIYYRGPLGSVKNLRSLEAYNESLQQLKRALMSSKGFKVETAVAIACLAMVEVRRTTNRERNSKCS
jgi:hypothetical protein